MFVKQSFIALISSVENPLILSCFTKFYLGMVSNALAKSKKMMY